LTEFSWGVRKREAERVFGSVYSQCGLSAFSSFFFFDLIIYFCFPKKTKAKTRKKKEHEPARRNKKKRKKNKLQIGTDSICVGS